MDTANTVIRELLNALDTIERAAKKNEPYATSYILGVVEQANVNAKRRMVRNSDGYLVVEESK